MPTTEAQISNPAADKSLLIVGASARQTAQSAAKAGYKCLTIDLFADWDLHKFASAFQVDSMSEEEVLTLIDSLAQPPGQFIICGGMEKRTQLIDSISQRVPYVGTSPSNIERTNDPFTIRDVCLDHTILFPEVTIPKSGRAKATVPWLQKPFASSGGSGIRIWDDSDTATDSYLQQFVSGDSYSALFCTSGSTTRLTGVTRQLVGLPEFTSNPFAYCGSVGPIEFESETRCEVLRYGSSIAREFDLRGVFGLDLIVDQLGRLCLIEINPRITASAEVFERAGLVSSIVCCHLKQIVDRTADWNEPTAMMIGKATLFSSCTKPLTICSNVSNFLQDLYRNNSIADVPCTGTVIEPAKPILTLFVCGARNDQILAKLKSFASLLMEQIRELAL